MRDHFGKLQNQFFKQIKFRNGSFAAMIFGKRTLFPDLQYRMLRGTVGHNHIGIEVQYSIREQLGDDREYYW